MRQAEADALAAEIKAQHDRHIRVTVDDSKTCQGRFPGRVVLRLHLVPGGRTATIWRRKQWESLLSAWQWFF